MRIVPEQAQLTCRSCEMITLHCGPSTRLTSPDCTGRRLVTIATYSCLRCGSVQAYRIRSAETATIDVGLDQSCHETRAAPLG